MFKIPPTFKYVLVAVAILLVLILVVFGSIAMPKETENVTSSWYDKTLQLGDYSFAVSDVKYDTYTDTLGISLYHMTAEPVGDEEKPAYFMIVYANEDKNVELKYTLASIDANTDTLTISDVPDDYTSVAVELFTRNIKGDTETISVSIDRRDIATVDSSTYVYVYVTATPVPTTGKE